MTASDVDDGLLGSRAAGCGSPPGRRCSRCCLLQFNELCPEARGLRLRVIDRLAGLRPEGGVGGSKGCTRHRRSSTLDELLTALPE